MVAEKCNRGFCKLQVLEAQVGGVDFQQRLLLEGIAAAANTASTSIGAFGGELKLLNQAINPTTKDIGAFGGKAREANKAQSDSTKATNKNTQEKKRNTKGTKDLNDISLQASFAISLAAGGMATFGDRLKESENNLVSMTGQLISATSTLAMYVPTLMTINQMMAGGFKGGLKRFGAFLTERRSLGGIGRGSCKCSR